MQQSYRFGQVEVRPVERQIVIDGRPAALGSRAFDVLIALIERRDRVVTKNELLEIVWPGLVVEENNLQAQVSALRKLLGAEAFATIPGFGYRFAVALENDVPTPSSPPPPGAPRTNLLDEATALIGRDADLPAVSELVGEHRLVTILGAGGIGKTRIARSVARQLTNRYAQGVWWVDLAAISSADKIAPAIASAASVRLGDGDAVALLARALGDREILLVLDNCEHLAKEVARVASAALASAPALRILATSQEVLQVAGERVYRLDSLAVPAPGTALDTARSFGAVQLLEERAQAADRRFCLGEETIASAIELCRHLDGIALAIEMAAARIPLLGIEALHARLGERLRMLRNSDRAAPARHQTLRGTLDWSHSLLSDEEQAVLRRLAVFSGSFRLDMAQKVSAGDGLDEWAILDALMALADKSLLQVEPGHSPRYRLLESTRLYALERLAMHGEIDAVQCRHGQAMTALAREMHRDFPREAPPIAEYTPDYEDLHAAFDRAAGRRDAEVAAWTGLALTVFDFERNVHSNVRRRKEAAIALLDVASPLAKARLLNLISYFRLILVPSRTRLSVAQERVASWRALGNRANLYIALTRLGADLAVSGNFEASDKALEEARTLEDPQWAPYFRWFHVYAAKSASMYRDDPHAYMVCSQALLQAALETKSAGRIAEARVSCAEAVLLSGNVEDAIRLSLASIRELRELDQPISLIDALTNLSAAYASAGDLDSARVTALDAIRLPWQLESAVSLFDQIGALAARLGMHSHAARILGFADRGYTMTQDVRHTLAARVEKEAAALIEGALGSLEHSRLRALGTNLKEEQAEALAKEALQAS